VKWETDEDIVSPEFRNVTINNVLYGITSEDNKVAFAGIYSPRVLHEGDQGVLYMGAGNNLYYPNADVTIKSCRGYFRLKGITAGDLSANAIELNFDGGETTGIDSIQNSEFTIKNSKCTIHNGVYDLSGRQIVNGKWPNGKLPKGIYINNGKKIVIK